MQSVSQNFARFRRHLTSRTLRNTVRGLLTVEAQGVRTALSVALPLIAGQISGYPGVGLMAGLGGLNVAAADKEGATWRTLLCATIGVALAGMAGTLIGQHHPLAVASIFLIAFMGGMMTVYGNLASQLGFVVTLVFAIMLGVPAPLKAASERFVEFGVGGLWCTLLTVLMWRIEAGRRRQTEQTGQEGQERADAPSNRAEHCTNEQDANGRRAARRNGRRTAGHLSFRRIWHWRWRKLRRNLTLRSEAFQHAVRLAFISALAVALYKFLRLEHGAWLTLTVLVIVKPDYASTRTRAGERVFGTLIGSVLALVLSALVHSVVTADILLLCLSGLAYSHQSRNYGLYTVFLTPFVVLLLNIAAPGGTKLALVRVTDTLLGGALALLMAYILTMPFAKYRGQPHAANGKQ